MRTPHHLSRRRFLQTAAVASAAMQLTPKLNAAPNPPTPVAHPYPENGTLIPDEGWHLWIDDKAAWKEDDIFLPEDVSWIDGRLCGKGKPLPVSAPTGGWFALTAASSLKVTLPTSVEQHCWDKYGSRPYTPEEYRYAADTKGGTITPVAPADDNIPRNGAYFGVSWWYREIEIPAAMRGKRIFLHIRAAHLRAEVYLNGQLCGYSIMEELPFEADLTHAADPGGKNTLAIRITNPFGRFDWVDGLNAKWGNVSLYRSHGFGALDRGITISAHDGPRIKDAWVLNTPKPKTVKASVSIESPAGTKLQLINWEVIDPVTGKRFHNGTSQSVGITTVDILTAENPSKGTGGVFINTNIAGLTPERREEMEIAVPESETWDINSPKLYHLQITVLSSSGKDTRIIAFGFRSFGPEGIGPEGSNSDALFRLNGRRIRIYSSISWGFWGLNGMFPVPELAEKEVVAAKTLGLNCLNFHRNLAKEDVLRKHDELGLLRYMEPGAGKMAIGKLPSTVQANAAGIVMEKPTSEADKFAQRYMFVKCVEMVKAFRSHPSVIEYCLQNEIGADLKNPATLAVLKAMHDEDPSRMVVLNDGFVARGAAQAWYEPWSSDLKEGKLHRSDEEKWGDFWNNHQGAGDQWYDEFYKSPTDYTYRAPFRNILTEFGEMEGCARADIHGLMIHQITETYKKYGGAAAPGVSYDLKDHEEIVAGYNKFLDRWGFRKAFPTPDHVFLAVGRTCYESWMNYMENARISDELDFAVISGWESTAIENHSGIVDNLRNFKSDPKLIAGSLLPVRPIAKQRAMCVEQGKPAVFDLYLANDTPKAATGTLIFSMITPSGQKSELVSLPAPTHVTDQFSYMLKEKFETPALSEVGLYRFKFSLLSEPLATQTKEIWVTPGWRNEYSPRKIAVSGITASTHKQLEQFVRFGITLLDFKPGEKYDLIISGGLTSHTSADQNVGETTGEAMPVMKPGHAPEPGEVGTPTELGRLQHGILEAVQTGTPLFAIPQADTLSDGVAQQLAAAGAFTYHGVVGDFRAPWMGNWYFGREHVLFEGLPTNAALGCFYQIKGRQSNGLLVEGKDVEVVVGYSRDHDRNVGAGTFTTQLGKAKVIFHRTPEFHPVLQQRFLANAIGWLTT